MFSKVVGDLPRLPYNSHMANNHYPINWRPHNEQPIEKAEPSDVAVAGLDVHSIFPTLQGEGPFVGHQAVFVRLAGCNLQCPLCDTEYTLGRSRFSIPGIYDAILDHVTSPEFRPLIVITGGEPFRQANLGALCKFLLDKGYRVQIETNGTLYQPMPWHHKDLTIVCSPKAGKVNSALSDRIAYYKYVVTAGDVAMDGLPNKALEHSAGPRGVARPPAGFDRSRIYVQPVDTRDEAENKASLDAAMASCRQHGYSLCLQTHKLLELP